MTEKKVASKTSAVSDKPDMSNQVVDVKAIHIYFDERQIPKIAFCGVATGWSIRDILHVKRLLTREYKRYLRLFIRRDVKKEE